MYRSLVWPNPAGIWNSFERGLMTALRNMAGSILRLLKNYVDYCAMLMAITRTREHWRRSAKNWMVPSGRHTIWRSRRFYSEMSWDSWQNRAAPEEPVSSSKNLSDMILNPQES